METDEAASQCFDEFSNQEDGKNCKVRAKLAENAAKFSDGAP